MSKEIKVDGPGGTSIIGRPSGVDQFNQTYEITTSQGKKFVKSQWDGKYYEEK
jgi:hypothetical protein